MILSNAEIDTIYAEHACNDDDNCVICKRLKSVCNQAEVLNAVYDYLKTCNGHVATEIQSIIEARLNHES